MSSAKNLVIIGGGVSTKHAAEVAAKASKDVKVTVIQACKFVEWPIAMTVVLATPETHYKALATDPAVFQVPGVTYQYGVATGVNAAAKQVTLKDGAVVPYDALIVATGFKMPLIYPELGASLEERQAEIKTAGEALRAAETVVVNGGGPVGVELVGDLRVAYPKKRIMLLVREGVLKQFPADVREKTEAAIKSMNIEIVVGTASNAPEGPSLQPGVLNVSESVISYDVYIPAFSPGKNTDFLKTTEGLLDETGAIIVNDKLQSVAHPEIFAVGVANIDEGFIGMPKLESQWIDASKNSVAVCTGKPLKVHKEGMKFMRTPPVILVGRGNGGWAHFDFKQLPPPLRFCCCDGKCGCPCCPPPCCWCCCHPGGCGRCCGPPSGSGPSKLCGTMAFQSAGFHFKGVGKSKPPEQQTMA